MSRRTLWFLIAGAVVLTAALEPANSAFAQACTGTG